MRARLARLPFPPAARRWLFRVVRNISRRVHPERILLFGSFARGRGGADSDIDLLVILRRPRDMYLRYILVDKAIGEHHWPVDLIVRSPEEVEERLRIGDSFFRQILRRGVLLYES